ncbi:hypothetical protein WI37_08400 [Burkholderia ubonensis]|nr:hypothetical protein WI37_08400 [Burkholderia ubonensis]
MAGGNAGHLGGADHQSSGDWYRLMRAHVDRLNGDMNAIVPMILVLEQMAGGGTILSRPISHFGMDG